MATTNLGMEIVPTSDFVSPEPFNRNFTKLDNLGVDYITSSGKTGEWWWRKWKSGRAECGIDTKNFGAQPMGAWHGWYATSNYMSFGAFPFSFKSKPFCSIVFQGDTKNSGRSGFVFQRANSSSTRSPDFYLCDVVSTAGDLVFGIYVAGSIS